MEMALIIGTSRCVIGGERSENRLHLRPDMVLLYNMTTITTPACTKGLLNKLQRNIKLGTDEDEVLKHLQS